VKSLIKLIAFAGFMFGISAAGSWWMATHSPHSAEEAAATDDAASTGDSALHAVTGELPVAVRPKIISPEELLRNAMSLRTREAALQQQELAAQQRLARLELIEADIQGEQTEVEGLNAQVKAQIEAANVLLAQIAQERAAMEQQRLESEAKLKEFQDAQTKMDAAEAQNIKRMSAWIQGMEAETAASFLRELANDGKMDVAVQILANFEEREASKVLGAIGDSTLMIELADRFRTLQQPEKSTSRR
jgi:hypothetical protein